MLNSVLKRSHFWLGIAWLLIFILGLTTSIVFHQFTWITITDQALSLVISLSCFFLSAQYKK